MIVVVVLAVLVMVLLTVDNGGRGGDANLVNQEWSRSDAVIN